MRFTVLMIMGAFTPVIGVGFIMVVRVWPGRRIVTPGKRERNRCHTCSEGEGETPSINLESHGYP